MLQTDMGDNLFQINFGIEVVQISCGGEHACVSDHLFYDN